MIRRCPADVNPVTTSDQIAVGTPTLPPPPSLPRLHPLLGITPGDYSRNSWGGPVLTLASSFTRGDGRESWLSFSSKSRLDQAKYPNGPNVIPNAVRNLIWSSWQAKEADSQQSIYEEGIWSFTWRVSSSMVSWYHGKDGPIPYFWKSISHVIWLTKHKVISHCECWWVVQYFLVEPTTQINKTKTSVFSKIIAH